MIIRGLISLVVLALLAATLQALVFSGASFSDQEAGASISLLAGSVSHTNSKAGTLVLDVSYMRPGLSRSGTLTILGGPDVPATYTLSLLSLSDVPATPTSPPLSPVLQLQVDDVTGGTTLYSGMPGGFPTTSLGVISEGQRRDVRFTLTYPATAANRALMGAATTLQFEFVGVSL